MSLTRRIIILPPRSQCIQVSTPLTIISYQSKRCLSTTNSLTYPRKENNHREKQLVDGKETWVKTARYNKRRGMSAIRSTGIPPWIKLSVTKDDIKTPRNIRPNFVSDENHGLWGFFNDDKELLTLPTKEHEHGRAWTVPELRPKSFDDMHKLWWACIKERNRIATETITRKMLKAGYGEGESQERARAVNKTMKAIKQVLVERYYAWEDASKLARADNEVIFDQENGSFEYTPSEETMEAQDEYHTNQDWLETSQPSPQRILKRPTLIPVDIDPNDGRVKRVSDNQDARIVS